MIKLSLASKPLELSLEKQDELLNQFIKDGSTVWNKKYIKETVLNMAFNKCCFSEVYLQRKSNYLEIEHFYPKNIYPEKVVEWGNLFPSCKKCNVSKGNFDTNLNPIVNPFIDDPKDHLYFLNGRLYSKTLKGKITIDVLSLNDRFEFVNPRFQQADYVTEQLNEYFDEYISTHLIISMSAQKSKNRINKLKSVLKLGTIDQEFSANISTEILQNSNFIKIKKFHIHHGIWDIEFEDLEKDLIHCYLGLSKLNFNV